MESLKLFNMLQGPAPSPGLNAGKGAGEQALGNAVKAGTPDKKFADILGLAGDLQIADSQDVNGVEAFKADMLELEDSQTKALKGSTNEAQIGQVQLGMMNADMMALTGESIGRSQPQVATEIAPAKSRVDISAFTTPTEDASSLLLRNFQSAVPVSTNNGKPDGESVKQWAHALVRDDIKSVTLETEVAGQPVQTLAKESQVEKSLIDPSLVKAEKSAVIPDGDKGGKPDATQSKPNFVLATNEVVSDKSPTAQGQTSGQSTRDNTNSQKSSNKTNTQSGSDFVLERSVDHQVSSADFRSSFGAMASGLSTKAGLVAGSDLGQPGDSRIQPQALQFVADKVSQLKAQGGGRLHVAMETEGLGSIEIRVGMRAGQMHVQLSATNPETLKLLQNSRADLTGKLAQISDPVLEIGGKRDLKIEQTAIAKQSSVQANGQDFLVTRNAESSAAASAGIAKGSGIEKPVSSQDFLKASFESASRGDNVVGMGSREATSGSSTFDKGNPQPQSQPQFSRDFNQSANSGGEGRERAFDQWERSMKDRKTA